jgi:hypothetical protein
MRVWAWLVAALGVSAGFTAPARAGERFACEMHALSAAERARHHALLTELIGSVVDKRELADGYGFRFAPQQLPKVAEWIGFERRCCPFFTFDLAVARDSGPLWLEVRGSDGVKDFIRGEFGL